MRRLAIIAVALAWACGFDSGIPLGQGGAGTDSGANAGGDGGVVGGGDAAPDAMPSCLFGSHEVRFLDACGEQPSSGLITVTLPDCIDGIDYRYDTDTGELLEPSSDDEEGPSLSSIQPLSTVEGGIRVIWVDTLILPSGSVLFAEGDLPLAIVAEDGITIDGLLSVESLVGGRLTGAGSQPAACEATAPQAGTSCQNHGASGGGGGAFRGNGGTGGGVTGRDCDGVGGELGVTTGGTGTPLPPDTLRGGCAGAIGADADHGDTEDPGAPGGPGGGALYVLARGTILINGSVSASGAGGRGGDGDRGAAGGGGSGGYLTIQGQTVQVAGSAKLSANGGGGGGGGDGDDGDNGYNGSFSGFTQDDPPLGGPADNNGGDGGDGGYRGEINGQPGETGSRGGGGGAGGAGFIVILAGDLTLDPSADVTPQHCGLTCF